MRVETRRQIREAVLHDMAPAHAGQVSLEEVSRAFRGRGDFKEVEECLNDLVKEGIAMKTNDGRVRRSNPSFLCHPQTSFRLVRRITRGTALHLLSVPSSRLTPEKQRCLLVFRQVSSGSSFFLARM